jgi:uncharacterized protein YjbI with pentapeptide repeats
VNQQQQSRWRLTRGQLLWVGGIAALAFLITMICGYLFEWTWTGFPNRTLWDWLDLLIVPVVLAVGGYLFTRSENRATQTAAEQRAQDEALQAYLDQMSRLILEADLHDLEGEEQLSLYDTPRGDMRYTKASTLARARTLSILDRVDPRRKRTVLQTLYESALIGRASFAEAPSRPIVDLRAANLAGALLHNLNLTGVYLPYADLSGADLSESILNRATLDHTDLSNADLNGTLMHRTDLTLANLKGAELTGAGLNGAEVTEKQLEEAKSLQGATMPNGQKYEDWLKSRENRGEDEENGGP